MHLTQRQREVAKLMASGQSDKEIAATLGISDSTAHHHVNKVLEATGTTKRVAAVVKLLQAGVLDLGSIQVAA